MYHALSPETAEFIDEMFDGGLFDVLSKEGKPRGGYCTYLAVTKRLSFSPTSTARPTTWTY